MKEQYSVNSDLDLSPEKVKIPEFEEYVARAYERNHGAKLRKETLMDMLDKEDFNKDGFLESVRSWNENEEKTKGFGALRPQLEVFYGKNGKVKVYNFGGSDAIKFVAELL